MRPSFVQLNLEIGLRILPLPHLFLELLALVHDDLAVFIEADAPAFERPGGGAFEVDAGDLEAAAMAWAFELLGLGEPVRSTAQVRAGRAQGVEDAAMPYDPDVSVLEVVGNLVLGKVVGEADRDLARGLGQDVGEEKANRSQDHADEGRCQSCKTNCERAPKHGE